MELSDKGKIPEHIIQTTDFGKQVLYEENDEFYNIYNTEFWQFEEETFQYIREFESSSETSEASEAFLSETNSFADEFEDVDNMSEIANSGDIDSIIRRESSQNLTLCVLIDKINGTIQCCNNTNNFQKLWQLIGIWQVDKEAVEEVGLVLERLDVCNSYFNFDQNQLHDKGDK